MKYGAEYKEEVKNLNEEGLTVPEIAEQVGLAKSTVERYLREMRSEKKISPNIDVKINLRELQEAITDGLNLTDYFVYSVIKLLSKKNGYCFATNSYLGSSVSLGERELSRVIAKLNDSDYIHIEYTSFKKIKQRLIYPQKNIDDYDGLVTND